MNGGEYGTVSVSGQLPTAGQIYIDQISSTAWKDRYSHALLGVFGQPQRVLVRGEGCYVWDADGRRYLDLLAGIAVNALGHAHPFLTSALTAQLATLGHISNLFASPAQIMLAERLLALISAPEGSRVFFANSGTEANEGAFKLARRTGRPRMIALEGAFHGRTMGALALTAKEPFRAPFAPLPSGVEHIPFGDIDALETAMGDDVAAVFVEPIQGEVGVRPLPPGYLARARELTHHYGALLIVDEVQTGMGRTGTWLGIEHPEIGGGVLPDAVTLAKGLGGGFPIGALITYGEHVSGMLERGQHGTTFGGNPVASAASLATMHVIERDGLLANATAVGSHLREQVVTRSIPHVCGSRGVGLLIAIEFDSKIASVVQHIALDKGFIVNAVSPTAIRLAPPLIIEKAQLDSFIEALPEIIAEAFEGTWS